MKKKLAGVSLSLLVLAGFSLPFSQVAALTSDQINAIIALVRSFGVDESVVKNVDDSLNGRTPSTSTPVTPTVCFTFTRDLGIGIGMKEAEADALGAILLKEGLLSTSNINAYDEEVAAAVVKLQAKYGIRGTGYIGPLTRAKLNSLCSPKEPVKPLPSITVLSPNGESYARGSQITISFRVNYNIKPLNIHISGVNGLDYYSKSDSATVGENKITLSPEATNIPDGRYRITLCDGGKADPACGVSYFNVISPTVSSSITVLSPNGGENYREGDAVSIKWSDVPSNKRLNVWLLDAPTRLGRKLFDGARSDLPFSWSVSSLSSQDLYNPKTGFYQTPSGTYVIFIECVDAGCVSDASDAPFTISSVASSEATITVIAPNGGENLLLNQPVDIKWSSKAFIAGAPVSIVLLQRTVTAGVTSYRVVSTIDQGAANTGIRTWVPQKGQISEGGDYFIQVGCPLSSLYPQFVFRYGCRGDMSDGPITIGSNTVKPTITVLSPNGGETWQAGSSQTIRWTSSNIPSDYVLIQFSKGSNIVYDMYARNIGSVSLIAPTSLGIGDDFKVTVGYKNSEGVFYSDSSDSYFKIISSNIGNSAPQIVTSTSLPGNIQPGQVVNFSWTATDADSDDLSWGVIWGDNEVGITSFCSTARSQNGRGQTYTTSHSFARAGNYQVKAVVTDCFGGVGLNAFTVTVGNVIGTAPVISGLTAPTSLTVGETGTWAVKAYDPDGTSLNYSVVWGDEISAYSGGSTVSATASVTVQNSIFTHIYSRGGTFTPVFTVTDASGLSAKTSASVSVGSAIQPPVVVALSHSAGYTATFSKTFQFNGSKATLALAADNQYTASVNGTVVASNISLWNFTTPYSIDISPYLRQGENKLEIKVTNTNLTDGLSWSGNQGGLIYKVTDNSGATLASSDGTEQVTTDCVGTCIGTRGTATVLGSFINGSWTSISGAQWIWDPSDPLLKAAKGN